jgi:hypothetical protein
MTQFLNESDAKLNELLQIATGEIQEAILLVGVSDGGFIRYLRDARVMMPSKISFLRTIKPYCIEFVRFTDRYKPQDLPDSFPEKKDWNKQCRFIKTLWNSRPIW